MTQLGRVGIFSAALRFGDRGRAATAAAEAEQLGYTALWFPDDGNDDIFDAVENLLGATTNAVVCTGILNLWRHSAVDTAEAFARFADTYGPHRSLAGIGNSHGVAVEASGQRYERPVARTRQYLDALDSAPIPLPAERRALAALGPKMLELARDRTAGAHPYLVPPEHTAFARDILGPDKLLLTEQAVLLETDPGAARAAGRSHLALYLTLPNYLNNWRRLGFDDDDFAGGGSDRLVDALVAWGDEDAVAARVRAHFDAGADHVCVQALEDGFDVLALDQWRRLAPALVHTHR